VEPGKWGKSAEPEIMTDRLAVVFRGVPKGQKLRLMAAPVEMWQAVPEPLLPSWSVPVDGLTLSVPRTRDSWRLRVAGNNYGSTWIDVSPSQTRTVVLIEKAKRVEIEVEDSLGRPADHVTARIFSPRGSMTASASIQALLVGHGNQVIINGAPLGRQMVLVVLGSQAAPEIVKGTPVTLPPRVELQPGATLKGIVLNSDSGEPVDGADVAVDFWVSPDLPWPMATRAVTDDHGNWEQVGIPFGKVMLTVRAPGYVRWSQEVDLGRGGPQILDPVMLLSAIELGVIVHDDVDQPVTGAQVTVRGSTGVSTDSEGRAVLRDIPRAGGFSVSVAAAGHLPKDVDVGDLTPHQLSIQLMRAFVLSGRLFAPDGLPIVGGKARIETPTSFSFVDLDDQGRFSIDLPPYTPYRVVLRSPSTNEVGFEIPAGNPGEHRDLGNIVAPRGVVVAGRVISDVDGEPVAGARVWTLRPSPRGPLISWMHGDILQTNTDSDGRFTVSGLSRLPFVIRIDAPAYARSHVLVEIKDESDVVNVGEVTVERGAEVRVEVTGDTDGVLTAKLDLRGEGLPFDTVSSQIRGGAGVLSRIPSGQFNLSVVRGPKVLCDEPVMIHRDDSTVTVVCEARDTVVSGRVFEGDDLADGGTLVWMSTEKSVGSFPDGIMNFETSSGLSQQALASSRPADVPVMVTRDGSFESREISPGQWRVGWYPPGRSAGRPIDVTVPSSSTFSVDLDFPALTVSGRVVDEDDRPIADIRVYEMNSGALDFSDPAGAFSMSGIPPGPVRLQARSEDRESDVYPLVVDPDNGISDLLLVLHDVDRHELLATVLGRDGTGQPGSIVFLQTDNGGNRLATAGSSGIATFELRLPLPGRFRAAAFANGSWILGEWAVFDPDDASALLVDEGAGALVVTADGVAGPVAVKSQDGWDVSWLMTRVGVRPMIAVGHPLRLVGLPAGTYTIVVNEIQNHARVQSDRETSIDLTSD